MTKTRVWSLLALIVGLFAVMVVSGCGSSDDTSSDGTSADGTVASSDLPLLKPGTLTVGSDIPYPPFEQGDAGQAERFEELFEQVPVRRRVEPGDEFNRAGLA